MSAALFNQFLRPPKSVAEYDAEAMDARTRREQLRGAERQNAFLTTQQDVLKQGMLEKQADEAMVSELARTHRGNPNAFISALENSGRVGLAERGRAMRDHELKSDKSRADIEKSKSDAAKDMQKAIADARANAVGWLDVVSNSAQGEAWVRGLYTDPLLGKFAQNYGSQESLIATIPKSSDPAAFQAWRKQVAMGTAEVEKLAQAKLIADNKNKTDITTTKMTNDTSRANTAATVGAIYAGQRSTAETARQRLAYDREQAAAAEKRGTIVDRPDGVYSVLGTTARPVVGANGQPLASKASAERQASSARMLDLLNDAEKLLKDATGSLVGKGIDAAVGTVGLSTRGSVAIADLRPIMASMILQGERLEGPQSDADRAFYAKAAGDLDNSLVPYKEKLAALQRLRFIHQGYVNGTRGRIRGEGEAAPTPAAGGGAPAAAPGASISFGDLKK
jgi:hypothetical protein